MSAQPDVEANEFTMPRGFRAAGAAAGLKAGQVPDMALIVSDEEAAAAGVFTTNRIQAAPVKLCRERVASGSARAIVVNSGNANACTGKAGLEDAHRTAQRTAEALGLRAEDVLVCSTGRIGSRLPMHLIEKGIVSLAEALDEGGGRAAAQAILTTDTRSKTAMVERTLGGVPVRISGMAKGAGMIEPHMATMLAFLTTDAAAAPGALQQALTDAVGKSFNRISVDGDTSTNDTVLFLANGCSGSRRLDAEDADWPAFVDGVDGVCRALARMIVEDGEGATRFVTVRVRGAVDDAQADRAARAVAHSLLIKTSWVGSDPNWGRVMDALGYSGAELDEERLDVWYDGVPAALGGVYAGRPVAELEQVAGRRAFTLSVDLHLGAGEAEIYTCNCTEEYVRINM